MLQLLNLVTLTPTNLLLAIHSKKSYAAVSCWAIRMQIIYNMFNEILNGGKDVGVIGSNKRKY